MEYFLIFGLMIAVVLLWDKNKRLERRLDNAVGSFQNVIDSLRETIAAGGSNSGAAPKSVAQPIAEPNIEPASPITPAAPIETSDPAPEPETKPLAERLAEAEPEPEEEPTLAAAAYSAPSEQVQTSEVAQEAAATDGYTVEEVTRPRFNFDFEDIFGRRLPIWAGGFALAIAGIFLVRYSIEAGLITPAVRVIMSFAFGLALLAGAEGAYRYEDRVRDPRVRQALAGAGLATLYGAFYLAGTAYGLIGAGAAFVGLAAVTAAAVALSFRFGLPCAVIGLVGGFAAPMLVDSDSSNIPLLSFYLALVTGGLTWAGQSQGRSWMGYAALAAGLGWGVLMMFAGVSSTSDFAALGLYLIVLGSVLPAFLHSKGGPSLPKLAAGGIATLQMAVLVSNAGFDPLTWALYLLIGAALSGLGWRYPDLRLGTLVGAGLGLWLLAIWPDPLTRDFILVAGAMAVIFAGMPLFYQWRSKAGLTDLAQLSAVAAGIAVLSYVRFGSWGELPSEPQLAASFAALAVLPAAAYAFIWMRSEEAETRRSLILLAPAALLLFAALLMLTPAWLAPVMAAIIALALAALLWSRDALALQLSAWAGAAVTLVALAATPGFEAELARLGSVALEDTSAPHNLMRALIRWGAALLPFLAMALVGRSRAGQSAGEILAVILTYGIIAQAAPSMALAWIAALGAIALYLWQNARKAAWGTALIIAIFWAIVPVLVWLAAGAEAAAGMPFMADAAVSLRDMGLKIAPTAAALGVMVYAGSDRPASFRAAMMIGLGILAVVVLHSLYKQVWGIETVLAFEHYALGERTIWQAGLLAAAFGLSKLLPQLPALKDMAKPVSLALIAVSLAHFIWFTLVLHNPLTSVQHVGPTPIANWLPLAYLTAIAGLWFGLELVSSSAEEAKPGLSSKLSAAVNIATMVLIGLLAYSLLRQIFAGSVLTSLGIGQSESLLISLLGIVLALAYLAWGSLKNARSWRIGSLVLMLGAVGKVFLVDAAVLDGLLRIASFMALGFSLIGIGWVYSRQLSSRDKAAALEQAAGAPE